MLCNSDWTDTRCPSCLGLLHDGITDLLSYAVLGNSSCWIIITDSSQAWQDAVAPAIWKTEAGGSLEVRSSGQPE